MGTCTPGRLENPVLGATPLADHHGVPWAGPALIVLAVKSPLADLHGAYAPCAGRGHLSGWALVRQGEWSTQSSELLHWLTTMECPGPVLP